MGKIKGTPLITLLNAVSFQNRQKIDEAIQVFNDYYRVHSGATRPWLLFSDSIIILLGKILDQYPEQARRSDEEGSGCLPIHVAASMGDVSIIQILLKKHLEGARTPNHKGKLPIHYAAREGRVGAHTVLLEAAPDTAAVATRKRKLPLHYAAAEGHMGIARELLAAYPEGVDFATSKGKVPLHFAARWGHLHLLHFLLGVSPKSAERLDWEGGLPLHDAAREGQAETAVALAAIHPVGMKRMNVRGEVPAALAARFGSRATLEGLLMMDPEAGAHTLRGVIIGDRVDLWEWDILELCLRGAVGKMKHTRPVSIAAATQSSSCMNCNHSHKSACACSFMRLRKKLRQAHDGTVQKLGTSFSNGTLQDGDGSTFLPLHAAVECGATLPIFHRVMKELDSNVPNAVQQRDHGGMLPLHHAVCQAQKGRSGVAMVHELLHLFPNGAMVRDDRNRLPLHLALSHSAHATVIDALLRVNVSSGFHMCGTSDRYHNWLPLAIAAVHKCELDVLYMLLRGDPTALATISL